MLKSNELKVLPQPDTPKSTAKNKFGFNQKIYYRTYKKPNTRRNNS